MNNVTKTAMIACAALAVTAAMVYVLVATNVISIPRIGADEAPTAVFYVAAGCYLAGGLLVLGRKRWLWIVGLAANTFVITIFFVAYHRQREMMLSAGGLATKMAQVLLEAGLIYLVAAGRSRSQPPHQTSD